MKHMVFGLCLGVKPGSLTSCGSIGKLHNIYMPPFYYVYLENNNSTYLPNIIRNK